MRVVITGAAGFVGSHIADRLVGSGHQVLVVDSLVTGKTGNLPRDVRLEELDIADPALLEMVSSFRPHLVSHCAAQASVPVSMSQPLLDASSNIIGGINVCQAAVLAGCSQFIYINTGGALYGEPVYLPCDEDHPISPASAYGLSKWTMERYLRILLPSSVLLKVLRLGNVYGPRQDPDGEAGVVAIFWKWMMRGEPVSIYGDGRQTRDFVYAADVALAHELAQQAAESITVNIGSGQGTTINEIFHMISDELDYTLPPEYCPERPGEVKHIVLANDRAKSLLGWKPTTSLRDGLRETVAWARNQSSGL